MRYRGAALTTRRASLGRLLRLDLLLRQRRVRQAVATQSVHVDLRLAFMLLTRV